MSCIDLPNIISSHYELLKHRRLDQLLLPGSHDSGAYQLLGPADAQLDGPPWQAPLYRLLQTVLRPLAQPWVLTQQADILHQLLGGIRFFDLRISVGRPAAPGGKHEQRVRPLQQPPAAFRTNPSPLDHTAAGSACAPPAVTAGGSPAGARQALARPSPPELPLPPRPPSSQASKHPEPGQASQRDFYVTHTLPCAQLSSCLAQVRSFLEEHPAELVVLRLSADWDHLAYLGPAEGDAVLALVERSLQGLLFDQSNLHSPEAPQQQQQGQQPPPQPIARPTPSGLRLGHATMGHDAAARTTGSPQLPTLQQVVEAHQPVIVFSELPCTRDRTSCTNMYLHASLTPFWANSPTAQGTLDGLQQQMQQAREAHRWPPLAFVAFAATPDVPTVARGLLAALGGAAVGLRVLAGETEALLPQLLRQDLGGVMSVTLDYPSEQAVCMVMAANFWK